jgi:serine/threonine-protein kinase
MAKEPSARYPTCRDFTAALSQHAGGELPTDHPTMVARAAALADQRTQAATQAAASAVPGDPKPKGRNRIWLVAAGLVAVLLVVAGVLFVPRLMKSGGNESPAPNAAGEPSAASAAPSAVLVQPAAADSLLLSPEEVSGIVGETLHEGSASSSVLDASPGFNRPECSPAIYPLEARMYDPSGYTAARQSLIVPPEGNPSNHIVDQSVALMPSAELAETFRTDAQRDWQACAGVPLTITGSDNLTTKPTLADVRTQGDMIVQDRTVAGDIAPGQRCQHALGVWSNVVAEAVVCDDKNIGDQAQRVVEAILANAKRS